MRQRSSFLKPLMCGLALMLLPSTAVRGDDGDSSADASAGFHTSVEASQAVMIRVPVNANGEEDTTAAAIRVYTGPQVTGTPSDFATAWNSAVDGTSQPVVNTAGDSSTSMFNGGYYGWYNPYRYNGWYSNYYSNYYPQYYYSGSYYNYGYPYYSNYSNNWYYGNGYNYYYRYYWYPRR